MRKRIIIFMSIVLVLTVAVTGAVFGAKTNKLLGSLKFWDGAIYSEQDQVSKKEISDSIDPVTGKSSKEFKIKAAQLSKDGSIEDDNSRKEKTVQFNLDGKEAQLKFTYITKSNKNVVLPSSGEGYQITSIPNSEFYLLAYNSSLYQLDIANAKITKVLSDQVDGYEYAKLKDKDIDDLALVWGYQAYCSPNGDYFIFYSNRNAVKNGFGNGQLWVKNLKTKQEYAVYDGGFEFAGWGENNQLFIKDFDKLVEINIEANTHKVIQEKVDPDTIVVYPYLVLPELGEIKITDLQTNETHSIAEGIGRVSWLLGNPSKTHVAMINSPDPKLFDRNILIVDLEDATYKKIVPDEGYNIDIFSWVDSDTLLVVTIKKGTIEQYSSVVHIKDLE
ncbi:MAG TPA: hypothetical protein VGE40_10505 [Bacilli bacterium]